MNDKIFIDSNVLTYCYSKTDLDKQKIARNLVQLPDAFISTQVINEVTNVLGKKYKIGWNDLIAFIQDFENNFSIYTLTSRDSIKACEIARRYGYSFYDSLIISVAVTNNCNILYTEDLQHNQVIDGLKIINPFI